MTVEHLFELEAALRRAAMKYAHTDHAGGGGLAPIEHSVRNAARKELRLAAVAYGSAANEISEHIDRLDPVEPTP